MVVTNIWMGDSPDSKKHS